MGKSVLSFLLPNLDGSAFASLQLVFALIFLAAVVAIPVLLRTSARPSRWESRLAAIDGSDSIVPVHDTPDALSHAVATPAERWADALPGLLLVLGLLGTFIGIGLALSETAGVLGGADALGSLTPIVDTLGTKFKISSWGILAFLLLKTWFIVFPYEQARLAWSTRMVKARTAQALQQQEQKDSAERQQLIDAITRSGNALLAAQQAEAQRSHVRHADLLDALQRLAPHASQAEDRR